MFVLIARMENYTKANACPIDLHFITACHRYLPDLNSIINLKREVTADRFSIRRHSVFEWRFSSDKIYMVC